MLSKTISLALCTVRVVSVIKYLLYEKTSMISYFPAIHVCDTHGNVIIIFIL